MRAMDKFAQLDRDPTCKAFGMQVNKNMVEVWTSNSQFLCIMSATALYLLLQESGIPQLPLSRNLQQQQVSSGGCACAPSTQVNIFVAGRPWTWGLMGPAEGQVYEASKATGLRDCLFC